MRLSQIPEPIVDASEYSRSAMRACAKVGSLWLCKVPGFPARLEVHHDPDQALQWYTRALGMGVARNARSLGATTTRVTASRMSEREIHTVRDRRLECASGGAVTVERVDGVPVYTSHQGGGAGGREVNRG